MNLSNLRSLATLAVLPIALAANPVAAESIYPTSFPNGARTFFAGNSFFVPVAGVFDQLAQANGFTDHQFDFVFEAGMAGTPGNLLANDTTRGTVTSALATGQVEQFWLSGIGSPIDSTSIDDYRNWFDTALSFNPDTHFVIAQPWVTSGPELDTAEFAGRIFSQGEVTFDIVEQLRTEYDNEILFINSGLTAAVMKGLFDAGELPDILALLPDEANMIGLEQALFEEPFPGHSGPMMEQMIALTWLTAFYGADLETLIYPDFESEVEGIVNQVLELNAPYLTVVPEPGALALVALGLPLAALRRQVSARRRPRG